MCIVVHSVAMASIRSQSFRMNESTRSVMGSALLMALTGVLLYSYLHLSETGYIPTLQNLYGFLLCALAGALAGILISYVNRLLNRWLSWKGHYASRLFAGFASWFIVTYAIAFLLGYLLNQQQAGNLLWQGFSSSDPDLLWKLFILLLVGSFIYSVVYSLLFSYNQYATAQIATLQQERKQLELQFEALKSQLSPHYLFNSLNTISSLIYKDPQTAEQFIRRLAQTYQFILSTQHKKFISLQEELEFVKSYYYLLRIRFQQSLNIEINIPNSIIHSAIPPLTLQLLIENAVKHNTLSPEKPLYIYIAAIDNTQLKVVNSKSDVHEPVTSTRIGLENIRQRYRYFTQRPIEIRNDNQFTVLLPVLHPEIPKAS